jgi:16S rRNA (guanine(966)-N(2))-methyltransferase RsmD
VRIIAGELKGRRLESPDWPGLRPTSDRLRETLFNVIAARMAGARVVDAYAGTGAVGIEALSRGAAHVTFVERDARAIKLIERNLGRCGVRERYAIIRAGFADAEPRLRGEPLDIIFLDPPYGAAELAEALVAASRLAGPGTLVIVEHARRDAAPAEAGGLVRIRDLTSGDSALAFYRRVAATDSTQARTPHE